MSKIRMLQNTLDRRQLIGGAIAAMAIGKASFARGQSSPEPQKGGSLRVGIAGGGPSDSLDPHSPITPADIARVLNLYDGLGDDNEQAEYRPLLAEEFEVNPSATEWTIRIKQGAEFHNGKTIGADDVAYTIRRIIDPKNPRNAAPVMRSIDPAQIVKLDDRTIRLKLHRPDAVLRDAFRILNTGVVPVDFDPKNPVGSGPFKLDQFVPGEQSTFKRFENYHGQAPYVDELVLIDLPDDVARVNALLGGQVHAIEGLPYSQIPVVGADSSFKVLTSKAGSFRPFTMRIDKPPFDDVRVRQAMRLLVDREQLVKLAFSGHGRVAYDAYSPNDPCFDTSLVRERDVKEARSLLARAGHSNLQLELATTAAAPGLLEASQIFAEQAREGDVTINVNRLDQGSFFSKYTEWPFAVDYWTHNPYLNQVALGELASSPLNPTHFSDEEFTRLNDLARAELDQNRRCELVHQMQRISFERGGLIIWGYPDTIDAHSAQIGGLEPDLTGWGLNRYKFKKAYFVA